MRVQIHDVHNVVLRASEQVTHGALRGRSFLRSTYEQVQASPDLHIFVADGAYSRKRRQEIYSGYKSKRPPLTEDRRAGIDLFKQIMTMSKAHSITCAGWEADDVIGTVGRQMALSEGVTEVVLHTNDSDFGQLLDFPGIKLPRVKVPPHPPVYVTLFKALCGDSTDEIPGLAGFGPDSFAKMAPYWAAMKAALDDADHTAFAALPWVRSGNAVQHPRTFDQLLRFYAIVQLLTVPDDEIDAGSTPGVSNEPAVHEIFSRYLL